MELPLELWLWVLGDPEHRAELAQAMEVAPEDLLAKTFRACFPPHDLRAASLVKGSLNQLTNQQIVANLERIRERAPQVLAALIKAWLEAKSPVLAGLTEGNLPASQWQADQIELGIWLWQAADQPLPEFWRDLVDLLRQAPAPAADPAIQAELNKAQKKLRHCRKSREDLERYINDLRHENQALNTRLSDAGRDAAAHLLDAQRLEQLEAQEQKWQDKLKQAQRQHYQAILQLQGKQRQEVARLDSKIEALTANLAQAGQNLAEITQEREQLTRQLAELEQERDQLSQQLTEASRRQLRVPDLPASGTEIFQQALIIDYRALGQSPTQRLIQLSELYSSLLQNLPHPALTEASNWPDLKAQNQEPSQILLLALEQLLYDQASLPIARWLRTAGFRSEALLAGLDQQLRSPRL